MLKSAVFKLTLSFVSLLLLVAQAKSQQTDSSFQQKNDTMVLENDTVHLPPEDTIFLRPVDTLLRIKNFSPYFTLHVDSTLDYQFEINRNPVNYYWYLKNSPVGLKINKDNGDLHFKAEKSFFLSGKLKYDIQYKVRIGVQNLDDPTDHVDTTFSILFYNTDIIRSVIKPTVSNDLSIDEGDTLNFKLQCEQGSFPLESITYYCNYPIRSTTPITSCGDQFTWVAPFDFIKEDEKTKQKSLVIKFIGVDKFYNRDTAEVKVIVNQAINYPRRLMEYSKLDSTIQVYILQLKATFRELDKKIKHTKNTRTTFDLTSASTSLGGTVFSSMDSPDMKTTGKILPSVGVALVPVKEAVAPNKNDELNAASLVRNDIKRLQYLLTNNALVGDKDPEIVVKTSKMKDELQQIQLQLIDVAIVDDTRNKEELDEYFNNPKVNRKYRLKSR
ncbi:hypothetical protein EFY79_15530 [Hanamia caeni]|jgi:hypothetical protein|uniref:Uncharacterized protein n=1 Tax=Hanamia caeni TaxID=2294116 RepID=A0A3M9NA10_9BACT|nr:hypothetical protein EFY79_15530 [Hanamia caeni]